MAPGQKIRRTNLPFRWSSGTPSGAGNLPTRGRSGFTGWGHCDCYLEPVSNDLPLPEGITYHYKAPQTTLKEVYGRCDAWLFTSRVEGFGLPILEAMACRTPVIGTPAGAAPELIRQGGGQLVPPEDPVAIAEAMVNLCTQPLDQWQALSAAAYQTASRYSWEDATTLFEAALEVALTRAIGPTPHSP